MRGESLAELDMNCTVSRDGKTQPRSGLAISHCEGSLIKGNGVSGNFECVFSVVFSARLGDSNSKTDAETIRAGGRMFLLCPLPPLFSSRLVIAHQSCCLSVKVDFIVSLLGAVVSFFFFFQGARAAGSCKTTMSSGGTQSGTNTKIGSMS